MEDTEISKQPRALVLEDDITLAKAYQRVLVSMGFATTLVHSISEARLSIRDLSPELIILDVGLPDGNGLDLMSELGASARGRFIVISGDDSQRAAIKSIRHQAVELLIKPVSLERLRECLSVPPSTVERVTGDADSKLPDVTSQLDYGTIRKHSNLGQNYPGFWIDNGSSSALRELRVAASLSAERRRGHALIVGNDGLEKSAIAKAVHYRSRRIGDCVVVDCGSVHSDLSLAGFFGTVNPVSGTQIKYGHIERARGGTLILERVHCLPLDIQSALMSFLNTGQYRLLNSTTSVSAVVAVIGITSKEQAGLTSTTDTLRKDFAVRLAQLTLSVPDLSQCVGDIEQISRFILADCMGSDEKSLNFSDAALAIMSAAQWPGNIRQLRGVIKESLLHHKSGETLELYSKDSGCSEQICESIEPHIGRSIWEFERDLFMSTLDFHDGDRKAAANTLGVSLKTFYNRVNAYDD